MFSFSSFSTFDLNDQSDILFFYTPLQLICSFCQIFFSFPSFPFLFVSSVNRAKKEERKKAKNFYSILSIGFVFNSFSLHLRNEITSGAAWYLLNSSFSCYISNLWNSVHILVMFRFFSFFSFIRFSVSSFRFNTPWECLVDTNHTVKMDQVKEKTTPFEWLGAKTVA